ncbi:MAG TPA: class I SAM-dependent methyltransferase [Acidobacteriota bacterium]|nr:class I SAM-dependent methyltransferase [Acidobacteriota bacterium]
MEEVKAYYNNTAKSYEEQFKMLYFKIFDAITWKYIEPYIPKGTDALVLDAGGGTGRWTIRIAQKGCRVILMDASSEMLGIATKRAKEKRLDHKITVKKGDIRKTDFEDETFDMILCEHALFLFKEPTIVIKELTRVLKRKAPLIISVPNRYVQLLSSLSNKPDSENVDNALKILLGKKYLSMTKDSKVKVYSWTPDEFRAMLERNRLCIEKIVGKGITMPLRISVKQYMRKKYSENLFNKLLDFELALCEKPDALALAGHLQAIAYKS